MKCDWFFPRSFQVETLSLGRNFCALHSNFSSLSYTDKKKVMTSGRPKLELPLLTQKTKSTSHRSSFLRKSDPQWYERLSWLAGCRDCKEGEHVLYCFPCALFSGEHTGCWSKSGYTKLANFGRDSRKHGNSARHVACEASLAEFGRGNIESSMTYATAFEKSRKNLAVSENRQFIEILICIPICFLAKQGLAFRGHQETDTEESQSNNKGNYRELVYALGESDEVIKKYLSPTASGNRRVFSGLSNHIQNDLIESVAAQIRKAIVLELRDAPFASVLVDESTDSARYSQLSILIRYVTTSGPHERFINFKNV